MLLLSSQLTIEWLFLKDGLLIRAISMKDKATVINCVIVIAVAPNHQISISYLMMFILNKIRSSIMVDGFDIEQATIID